ncbi:MAG TPA: glutathione S-transferase [Gammaproteobacteria bacterium]|nr:glutathione S-transferase [Gammaproteobacteria bacterium]
MTYELYYWPGIQGRGEFVRLALEEAGVPYVDVAKDSGGEEAATKKLLNILADRELAQPPFAPPVLKAGELVIAQTTNILLYLGARHGLAPNDEAGRLWTHQLQLTITDWVVEVHDTHHPLGPTEYYEDQKPEAGRRGKLFLQHRLPKFLGYFEKVLQRNPAGNEFLVGGALTYADLSLFQMIAGLRYAFPHAMRKHESQYPAVMVLHERVSQRSRIAAYLASDRRLPFNEGGLFRHYPELDK